MRFALSILGFALLGCAPASPPPPESKQPESPPVVVETHADVPEPAIDPRFEATLLAAAHDYRSWGRVDERPNLAPVLCRAPMGLDYGFPSHARLSHADDAEHGQKLYYLFAGFGAHSARDRYTALGTAGAEPSIPVGFTVVKQSWKAVPSSPPAANAGPTIDDPVFDMSTDTPAPIHWVDHEGQRLHVGEQADLFVMIKAGAADMPGTDAGWIYGTLTSDGRTVSSAGAVQRCMDCHDAAPHERLFGLQQTKAFATVKPSPWAEQAELPPELGLVP